MLYVSVDQTRIDDRDDDLKELLEIDLEDVHVAINLVNSNEEVNMISWDVIHKVTQEDGTMLKLMDYIQPAHVELNEEAPLIKDPATQPVRKRKPNVRYPATEFSLNSVRTRSRRTLRRAN